MRRRIALTMVALVVGALALAGVGTFGLIALDSVHQTEKQLATEAEHFAQGIQDEVTPGGPSAGRHGSLALLRQTISVLKSPLRLQGEALLAVRSAHDKLLLYNLLDPQSKVELPSGLKLSQPDLDQLFETNRVSGSRGRLAWAADLFSTDVPVGATGSVNLVVVLTREAPAGPPGLLLWAALASAGTVIVALIVANGLGRRITRPLQRTQAVTRRIASGDLAARVEVSGHEGPELISLATSVNHMAAELAQAQGTQRQFLMSVSHDLRTPLTSIKGFAEALADGATTDVRYAAGIISSEARRLERLVTDLLELAKLEAGAFSLQPSEVDLQAVVAEAVQAFEPAAGRLGLDVVLEPGPEGPGGRPACWADPDRLGQVVANVVENALKYASSRVVVKTAGAEGEAGFSVEDDGPGIPTAELERVFERLYQSRAVSGRNLGSGLGLAIVAELVTAMGGRVWAEPAVAGAPSQDGAGTRVVVTLPAAPSHVAGSAGAGSSPAQ